MVLSLGQTERCSSLIVLRIGVRAAGNEEFHDPYVP